MFCMYIFTEPNHILNEDCNALKARLCPGSVFSIALQYLKCDLAIRYRGSFKSFRHE